MRRGRPCHDRCHPDSDGGAYVVAAHAAEDPPSWAEQHRRQQEALARQAAQPAPTGRPAVYQRSTSPRMGCSACPIYATPEGRPLVSTPPRSRGGVRPAGGAPGHAPAPAPAHGAASKAGAAWASARGDGAGAAGASAGVPGGEQRPWETRMVNGAGPRAYAPSPPGQAALRDPLEPRAKHQRTGPAPSSSPLQAAPGPALQVTDVTGAAEPVRDETCCRQHVLPSYGALYGSTPLSRRPAFVVHGATGQDGGGVGPGPAAPGEPVAPPRRVPPRAGVHALNAAELARVQEVMDEHLGPRLARPVAHLTGSGGEGPAAIPGRLSTGRPAPYFGRAVNNCPGRVNSLSGKAAGEQHPAPPLGRWPTNAVPANTGVVAQLRHGGASIPRAPLVERLSGKQGWHKHNQREYHRRPHPHLQCPPSVCLTSMHTHTAFVPPCDPQMPCGTRPWSAPSASTSAATRRQQGSCRLWQRRCGMRSGSTWTPASEACHPWWGHCPRYLRGISTGSDMWPTLQVRYGVGCCGPRFARVPAGVHAVV